jgi:SPP1 family phage portal protein
MDAQLIIQQIQAGSQMNRIIHDLIDEHTVRATYMKKLYEEYKGDVFIKHREYEYNEGEKVDRKIASDYRGYIVDTLTGYLFGNPVTYSVDSEQYGNTTQYDQTVSTLKMFIRRNSISDLDAETGKKASICGYGARLMYFDADGKVRIMNVSPWECIFINDPSLDEPQYAMRYYKIETESGESYTHVEWYDDTNWQEFEERSDGLFYPVSEPKAHLFKGVPLVEFPNNEERLGDFEKVREAIDGYDILISDVQSELEEQRLAYMVFSGSQIDQQTLAMARKTGAFNLPESTDKVYYLVKQLSDTVIENQKRTLKENIHKFSKTVDMSDETFSGASQSGESRKWKLLAMENLSIIKERKFTKALRLQFSMIEDIWRSKNIPVLDDTIVWKFSRNLPVEMTHEATILSTLHGHISDKTRLSLASFIDDAETEMEQMKTDQEFFYVPPMLEEEPQEETEEEENEPEQ